MCMMCDGFTEEEMLAHWCQTIEVERALILTIDSELPWAYTIGLRWQFDHPELIAVHPDPAKANGMVRHAVDDIAEGHRLGVGDVYVAPCGGSATVRPVHHANVAGEWFRRWPDLAHRCGHRSTSLRALQLVANCVCEDCSKQVLLDRRVRPA